MALTGQLAAACLGSSCKELAAELTDKLCVARDSAQSKIMISAGWGGEIAQVDMFAHNQSSIAIVGVFWQLHACSPFQGQQPVWRAGSPDGVAGSLSQCTLDCLIRCRSFWR
jgi:hypothetical protein